MSVWQREPTKLKIHNLIVAEAKYGDNEWAEKKTAVKNRKQYFQLN